jgi:hypothetical protein
MRWTPTAGDATTVATDATGAAKKKALDVDERARIVKRPNRIRSTFSSASETKAWQRIEVVLSP